MEFDPLARDAPPPRHDLESDSEGSEDGSGVRSTYRSFVKPTIQIQRLPAERERKPTNLLIAVGVAGEAFVQAEFKGATESATLHINGEVEASMFIFDSDDTSSVASSSLTSTVLVLLRPSVALSSNLASFSFVASALLESFQVSSLVVLDEYTPQLYHLKASTASLDGDYPIRFLTSRQQQQQQKSQSQVIEPTLKAFEAPNYITGITASLLTTASSKSIPTLALLVPSSGPRPHMRFASNQQPFSGESQQSVHLQMQARAEPLEPHLAEIVARQLKKWPGISLPATDASQQTRSAEGQRSITTFLDERRQRSRKNIAERAGSMYV